MRLKMLYPSVDQTITPLPRQLSTIDKSPFVNIKSQFICESNEKLGTRIEVCVRASNPIPSTCNMYYFEITVIKGSEDGGIGIGLTASESEVNTYIGYSTNAIGYHGVDAIYIARYLGHSLFLL